MMDIKELVSEHKLMLGGSVVKLEITDEEIETLIRKAYRKIKPFVTETKTITKEPAPSIDLKDEEVLEVIRVYPADLIISNGREVMFDFELFRKEQLLDSPVEVVRNSMLPDLEVPFKFENGVLYLDRVFYSRMVSIECLVDSSLDDIKDEKICSWIERYSLALCKEVLGRIRSKFKSSEIPVEFDGDTLLEEARTEKEELINQLREDNFGNFVILR